VDQGKVMSATNQPDAEKAALLFRSNRQPTLSYSISRSGHNYWILEKAVEQLIYVTLRFSADNGASSLSSAQA
jgi:hypothetical protein